METYIKGNYKKTIYQSTSGYYIGLFKVQDTNDDTFSKYIGRMIPFTGYFHELNEMDTYLFYGKMINHPKYGEQFQVERYERTKPEEKDAIVDFLTSGLFKGIGEKKAQAIVSVLGKDTLQIILENPDNLILIPGITKKNIDTLHHKLKEYEASYEVILYLGDIGFSTKDAMIVYNFYKERTKKIIEENIYQIVRDIYGMSFKKIDFVALKMGIKKEDPIRIQASILYIMEELSNLYGHSFYQKEEIFFVLPRVLQTEITEETYEEILVQLEKNMQIIKKDTNYYLKEMYEAETLIVKRLRLLASNPDRKEKQLDIKIQEIESFLEIQYNKEQHQAIKESFMKDFLIITGGPGTGKTTIMKAICELYRIGNRLSYEELEQKLVLLAPTGRAAKRMKEATSLPAYTIHRFLKWQKETNKFQVNEYNKSKAEFIILDEVSMIDTYLMASLLKGISANCKIVMVGDDHQLPSVGPGQMLKDLIDSKKLAVVELKELYRQQKDSNILSLAYDVREGEVKEEVFNQEEDLTFIECNSRDVMSNLMEIARTYKDLSYKKFQILAPMYKTLNGIDEINKQVQMIFNPKEETKKEMQVGEVLFREGDKVIQLLNMPDENVYNGDIGIIEKIISAPKKEIHIRFDQNIVKYTPTNFNYFRLAYAISIHKAQGSEFDVVILPCVRGYSKMLYRKLIYTAITRSKKQLYIIGEKAALKLAAKNLSTDRKTTIKEFLVNGIK